MAYDKSRSVRFLDDVESGKLRDKNKNNNKGIIVKHKSSSSTSLRKKVLLRVFSEDYERVKRKILDPRGSPMHRWNKVLLVACLVSLFVDPLFFFLPSVREEVTCIEIELTLELILTVIRTVADVFYVVQICVRFRTAYVAPSSRVFGRGELVVDPRKIAFRYFKGGFLVDLAAALPLPQVLIWGVIPNLHGSMMMNTKNMLRFIIIFQYIFRLFLIFPLSSQIVKATGVVTETAWAGAAYNLLLFILASHVLGACWYLLAIERQEKCWRHVCNNNRPTCQYNFFDCKRINDAGRSEWHRSSNITTLCDPDKSLYPFGIYGEAVTSCVTSSTNTSTVSGGVSRT